MKRFAMLASLVSAFALCGIQAAGAATGSWGRWEPTYQGAITAPAGTVCPFAVSAEPVGQRLQIRYHYDEAGNPDGYQVGGLLIGRITNTETGASVERNLSGLGTVMFNPDGSWNAVVEGNFLVFFRSQDTPSNQLLLFKGRTVLE